MSSGCDHLRLANDAIRLGLTGWACECGAGFPARPFAAPAPAPAPAAPPKFAHACPNGHRELQLRAVIDLDVAGAGEDSLECSTDLLWEDVDRCGGTKGIDGGVWCPACDEWFEEEECIWPADDAGNPIVEGLGDAGPGEGDDDPGVPPEPEEEQDEVEGLERPGP